LEQFYVAGNYKQDAVDLLNDITPVSELINTDRNRQKQAMIAQTQKKTN